MAKVRITLRVEPDLRERIERACELLSAHTLPGQQAMNFSDTARHCLLRGLDAVEAQIADIPVESMTPSTEAPNEAPVPKAPGKPDQRNEPPHNAATGSMDVFDMFGDGS